MTTHEANERILTLMSEYLCFTPTAIAPEDVTAHAAECGVTLNEAYMALLAAHCGLDMANTNDAQLYHAYFPHMIRQCNPDSYRNDSYYRTINPSSSLCGSISLVYENIQPMELFAADDFQRNSQGRIIPQLGWFTGAFTFPALQEGGRVWMTITPNEINTIQPIVRQTHGKVLTYGLGLGYYAFHALLRTDVSSVTVIEKNPQVIDVFRRYLLPFFPRQSDLRIIEADAFDYAEEIMPREAYDVVFTDLWRDITDGIPLYQRMKALETPGPRYFYWIEKTLRCYID